MRYLFTEFFQQGRNYTPADFQKSVRARGRRQPEEFFSRYVCEYEAARERGYAQTESKFGTITPLLSRVSGCTGLGRAGSA